MKTKVFFIAVLSLLPLTACVNEYHDGPRHVVIRDNDDHYHGGNGNFCPPGQAKKGNC